MPIEQRIIPEGVSSDDIEPNKIQPGDLPLRTLLRVRGLDADFSVEYLVDLSARCSLDNTSQVIFLHPVIDSLIALDVRYDEPQRLPVRFDDGSLGVVEWTHAPSENHPG